MIRRFAVAQAPAGRDEVAAAPPGRLRRLIERRSTRDWLLAALAAYLALKVAIYCDVVGVDAVDEVARVLGAAFVLFGVCGFGLTRWLLPDALRRHEPLWVLPVGACALAIGMTVLGFAGVPFIANLVIVAGALGALSVRLLLARGLPAVRRGERRAIGWPSYLALLLIAFALIPMFRSGFATVIGQGQDAHMAAGTAEFLKHAAPKDVRPELPVDEEWPTWRSKQAIYYATAAISSVSGLETYEVLSTVAALLFGLAAVGMFLVARDMLGAGVGMAALAMTLASLDRMALHTAMHPYFNQIWGYMTMPFGLVLAWQLVKRPQLGTAALLVLILAVDFFAYPLAGPITLVALVVFWWVDRRARKRHGEPVVDLDVRHAWAWLRRQRRLVKAGAAVAAFLLAVPVVGAYEKVVGGTQVMWNVNYDLRLWGGDLTGYYDEHLFFGLPAGPLSLVGVFAVVGLALWQLRSLPERPLAWGLFVLVIACAYVVVTMRLRDYGWYFHFKVLAFLGPLLVVLAALALRRVRYAGLVLLVVWTGWALREARDEAADTFNELPRTTLQLDDWARALPADASIRLDVQPDFQTWPAYLMHERRLCSQRPLMETAYPHVQISRAADYVLVRRLRKPVDAIGAPLFRNTEYALYRLRPGLPGGDRCSQRMVQNVKKIQLG